MTTYADDFMRLTRTDGTYDNLPIAIFDMSWPPPEEVTMYVPPVKFKRVSMSEISDEDRAEMTHLMRGAAYEEIVDD